MINKIQKIVEKIVCVLMSLLVFVVGFQSMSRFLFGFSIAWADEFARYSMIWVGYLGAVIGIIKNKHIGLKYLVNRINPFCRKNIFIAHKIFIAFFLSILIYQGCLILLSSLGEYSPAMNIPMVIPFSIIPISGVLMLTCVLISK